MDHQNVPIELISFRGLFKSFEDIQHSKQSKKVLNPNAAHLVCF